MSSIANITVFDGAATPVSHVLVPEYVTRNGDTIEAVWREQLASVPKDAQVRLTTKLSRTKTGVYLAEARGEVPVMETILNQNAAGYTAAPKIAFIDAVYVRGMFHPRSTITSRRLARQLVTNLLGNVSTSVVPVATGFLPELLDQLVSAS